MLPQCAITESSNHSFFIYYGHATLENCVIHTNPSANALKCVHGLVSKQWSKGHLESEVVRTTKCWRGQEAGEKCGVGEGESSSNGEQTTKSLESEWKTDRTVARRGEDLFLTAAVSSVSKQTSLMSLCVLLSQQSATVTQHWLQLKQGQEETNKGNETWIWNLAVHDSAMSPPEPPSITSG